MVWVAGFVIWHSQLVAKTNQNIFSFHTVHPNFGTNLALCQSKILNPFIEGGGANSPPPFWKTQFTQNFTLVSDYIVDLLFKWIPYAHFDTFFGILSHMGHVLGTHMGHVLGTPQSKKNAIL